MPDYTINELSALSGLPVRTIRYYLAEGLIPSAGREGPATRYPETTLARLRLISRLRDAHVPLAEIRKRLSLLADSDVVELTRAPEEPEPPGSALDYVRALLGTSEQLAAFETPPPRMPPTPSVQFLARRVQSDVVPPAVGSEPTAQPALGERSQWERVAITPDIELHLRRPMSRRDNRMVERLLAFARQLQKEDKP